MSLTRPRGTALRLLAVAAALVLSVPASASAAPPTTCGAHLEHGKDPKTLEYQFGCSAPIIGYAITFDQQIDGFDTEVPVLDGEGAATNELFSCEGGFPAYGLGCFGSAAHGGDTIRGAVSLDRDGCANPRYRGWLTVVTSAKGQSSGPFLMRGPTGCQSHTSPIQRLMAWIALLRKQAGT